MENIQTRKVIKYVMLPGILPRTKELFASGFGYTAFLMAHVYNMVRLLPFNHPYLNPANIGKFGFRHVIAEAANNLVVSRKNIDQIIIFIALLVGLVILFVQLLLLVYGMIISPAFAIGLPSLPTDSLPSGDDFFIGTFKTPQPLHDIALNMLDRVFGIPDFFCTEIGDEKRCTEYQALAAQFPNNFQSALHSMFGFYSKGLLMVAALIFLYFLVVIIGETATSGTPFGERFQNVWVPVRLILAVGLLLPMQHNINVAQYITLQAAKMGSGFATNGWLTYNQVIADQVGGEDNNGRYTIQVAGFDVDMGRNQPIGAEQVLALPPTPDLSSVMHFMSMAHGCAYATWATDYQEGHRAEYAEDGADPESIELEDLASGEYIKNPYKKVRPYIVREGGEDTDSDNDEFIDIHHEGDETTDDTVDYVEALEFFGDGDIIITFGVRDRDLALDYQSKFANHAAYVEPTCGRIRIPITSLKDKGCGMQSVNPASGIIEGCDERAKGGADHLQNYYYNLVKYMWPDQRGNFKNPDFNTDLVTTPPIVPFTQRIVAVMLENNELKIDDDPLQCKIGCNLEAGNLIASGDDLDFSSLVLLPNCRGTLSPTKKYPPCRTKLPDVRDRQQVVNIANSELKTQVVEAWLNKHEDLRSIQMNQDMLKYGWGGAGIWFNKIQEANGDFVSAVGAIPRIVNYPLIMEKVSELKNKGTKKVSALDRYIPTYTDKNADDNTVNYQHAGEKWDVAESMGRLYKYWYREGLNLDSENKSGSIFKDIMEFVFGIGGLGAMRGENASLHPLAQLTALGKGLVDSAVFNVLGGFAANTVGADSAIGAVGGFLSSVAYVGLTAGVVLFYVLPLLPFIYFFFAVGSWVKSIFEAMVGVPLWALAHLRIDGEGLPGNSAQNGYFLLFDIFIRPITTVFGLIASMLIFTAQVRILNFIWDLVVDHIAGFSHSDNTFMTNSDTFTAIQSDGVDQFFFTVIYAIIVYMLATASFKLIDEIPKSLNRWMGAGVSAFSDINDDPTEGLTKYAAIGGITFGRQLTGAATQAGGSLGKALGSEFGRARGLTGGGTPGGPTA